MNLSIIIPTFNERENLEILVKRIIAATAPAGIAVEIIVVDDNSPDGTAEIAKILAADFPLKLIERKTEHGLGSAIITGINQATSKVICVIDADLSHPPEAIPEMYKLISGGEIQLVIGSRRVPGGGTSNWIWYRKLIHWVAAKLGSFLTPVKDLTSGYFMFNREVVRNIKLEPKSWKIGLEIIVKGKYENVAEHPIVFVEREAGKSKMGSKEVLAYLNHLLSLLLYKLTSQCRLAIKR
jgi:dolichol-phosphate mannosyltransferase